MAHTLLHDSFLVSISWLFCILRIFLIFLCSDIFFYFQFLKCSFIQNYWGVRNVYFTPSSLPSFQKRTSLLQFMIAAAAAKSLQSYLTLCDPTDGSPSGSPTPGILQARTLEWVAISFSNAWKWKVKVKSLSHVRLFAIPWTAAYQAPPSMGFSRQEYWSGVPLPSPKVSLDQAKST